MKKLFLMTAILISTITFGTNVEKTSLSLDGYSKSATVIDEERGCDYSSTTIFYRTITREVPSISNEPVYETVVIIDQICTTCYKMNEGGTTSTTTCN